ncbi:MAG: hypothetical protein AAGN35_07720 [Bacteroidota bacterium]
MSIEIPETLENVVKQSVFRFTTFRNPRTPQTHVPGGIAIVLQPAPQNSVFQQALASAINQGGAQRAALIADQLATFRNGTSYIQDRYQLFGLIPGGFWQFAKWLENHLHQVDYNLVMDRIAELSPGRLGSAMDQLWDNLVYQSFFDGGRMVGEIEMLLRTDHFLAQFGTFTPGVPPRKLEALTQSIVLLPRSIFPLPQLVEAESEEFPPLDTEVEDDQRDRYKEIEKLREAIEELEAYLARKSEVVRRTYLARPNSEEGSPGEEVGHEQLRKANKEIKYLDEAQLDRFDGLHEFSRSTQSALRTMEVDSDLGIPFVTKLLERKLAQLQSEFWEHIDLNQRVIAAGGALWIADQERNTVPAAPSSRSPFMRQGDPDYEGFYPNDGKPRIRPLGIADYRKVEMQLCCYKPGELAHLENILQGEYRERNTRRLRRTEETYLQTWEREDEELRDTVTTDRFELQKESSQILQQDQALDLTASAAGQIGPMVITASAGYSSASSAIQAGAQAIFYAQDVIERSLKRVVERVREERISTVIEEFEEQNKHILDNRGGDKHVVGLYRWVDKVYKAQVVNYGKRLMLEFMVPEPANFHLWAKMKPGVETGMVLKKPIDPRSQEAAKILPKAIRSHRDITEDNYAPIAAQYGAVVEPPPVKDICVERNFARDNIGSGEETLAFSHGYNDFKIPEGYKIGHVDYRISFSTGQSGFWVKVTIGNQSKFFNEATPGRWKHHKLPVTSRDEIETLPVNICGRTEFYSLNAIVVLLPTDRRFAEWQLKTFNAILDAYHLLKSEYEAALAKVKANRGSDIAGTNPAMNRQIEQQELKKGCIGAMHYNQNYWWSHVWYYGQTKDWTNPYEAGDCHPPRINYSANAIKHGEKVKFFEQAFEWSLMSYRFYPYFWGSRCRWRKLYQLNDNDPLFLNFLQSGMARVLVPVRPGFEKHVMHFLRTGEVWQGDRPPGVDSPLYLGIIEELKSPTGETEGDPWEVRVPTSLTVLQCDSGCIEGDGLPCDGHLGKGFGVGTGGKLGGGSGPAEPHDH